PGGISSTRPVGTSSRSPGWSTASPSMAARRSKPALPGEAGEGRGRSRAAGSRWMRTLMRESRLGGALRILIGIWQRSVRRLIEEAQRPAEPAIGELEVARRLAGAGLAAQQDALGERPLVVAFAAEEDDERLVVALAADADDRTDLDGIVLLGAELRPAAVLVLLIVLRVLALTPIFQRRRRIRRLVEDQSPLAVVRHRVLPELADAAGLDEDELLEPVGIVLVPIVEDADGFRVLEAAEDQLLFLFAPDLGAPQGQHGRHHDVEHGDRHDEDDHVVAGLGPHSPNPLSPDPSLPPTPGERGLQKQHFPAVLPPLPVRVGGKGSGEEGRGGEGRWGIQTCRSPLTPWVGTLRRRARWRAPSVPPRRTAARCCWWGTARASSPSCAGTATPAAASRSSTPTRW